MKMFKWLSRLGHKMVDWLYENVLDSTAPSLSAHTSSERLREIKLRIHGIDPATGRPVPKAGEDGCGNDGAGKAIGVP